MLHGFVSNVGLLLFFISWKLRTYSFVIGVIIVIFSMMAWIIFYYLDYHNLSPAVGHGSLFDRGKLILLTAVVSLFALIIVPWLLVPILMKWFGFQSTYGWNTSGGYINLPPEVLKTGNLNDAVNYLATTWFIWVFYIVLSVGIGSFIWSIISVLYWTTVEGYQGLDRAKFIVIRNSIGFFIFFIGIIGFSALWNVFGYNPVFNNNPFITPP